MENPTRLDVRFPDENWFHVAVDWIPPVEVLSAMLNQPAITLDDWVIQEALRNPIGRANALPG